MLVSNVQVNSELFNTLAEMGILCTEEHRIRVARETFDDAKITECALSYDDIERVGYFYPHFRIEQVNKDKLEIWVGDEYLNPNEIQWIDTEYYLYGVLPRAYDIETTKVTVIYNDWIVKRYSVIAENEGTYSHNVRIDLSMQPYASLDHPDKCAYGIADGKIIIPEIVRLTENIWEYRFPYTRSLDVFFCTNLVGVFEMKAGVGQYIDSIYSKRAYHQIMVDHDLDYPINAKFYPCIQVDKDCVVRVYGDSSILTPMPELSRLLCYPEFMDITDPYNTDNEYLKNLPIVDDEILASDTDEVALDKLSRIAAYCYRAHERFPFFCNEDPDFLICDNTAFGHSTFVVKTVHLQDGSSATGIVTNVPFEAHRDVLFYKGNIFSNYSVYKMKKLNEEEYNEDPYGTPTYLIVGDYEIEHFTLLKFNAAEDTVISNIGDYIDERNVVRLHMKLNRFYRNMLVLRGSVLDLKDGDAVRVGTVAPTEHDEALWFELLVNAVPEMFEDNPELVIHSFGLDPDNVPEDIKEGAYTLDLPVDGGPEKYTELLLTYFKLMKSHKDYLVMQVGEGEQDPRIGTFTEIDMGPLPDNPEVNQNIIEENHVLDEIETKTEYESGYAPPSDGHNKVGDLFVEQTGGPGVDDLLDGINTIPENTFSLDTIAYVDQETGHVITGQEIDSYTMEQKKQIILRYITEGNEEEKESVRVLWNSYLDTMNEETLDAAVYKALLLDYIYNTGIAESIKRQEGSKDDYYSPEYKYVVNDEEPPVDQDDVGLFWVDLDYNASNLVIDETKKNNLKYVMSIREPDVNEIGTLWVNIPQITLQDYIGEMICSPILEAGYNLPEGFLYDLGYGDTKSTVVFDYGAHGTKETGDAEIFQEVNDQTLHPIHFGEIFDGNPKEGDIWFQFLDDIDNRVCYSDTQSMVMAINERLYLLEFDHDNITAFMFDDIVMNFRGRLGIRYISILSDLIASHVISLKDVNIFYKRLITKKDHFNPGLRRLYTGRDHVVSTADLDTTDYSVTYSTNIGRFHIDYESDDVINRERESAWRHVIDYSYKDIGFIGDRMLLFVNGHYIGREEYTEIAPGKIQLLDFDEIISCVDIFYSIKDTSISKAKRLMIQYWNAPDTSVSIQRPERDYKKFHPIHVHDYTYRGFYDVLMEEFIFSHKLENVLVYLRDHPDEADEYVKDLVRKFNAVSDLVLDGKPLQESRIVIPCFGFDQKYTIENE